MAFNGKSNLNICDDNNHDRFFGNDERESEFDTGFTTVNSFDQLDANRKTKHQIIVEACMKGSLDLIEEFLECGHDVNEFLLTGWSLLLYAASYAQPHIVQFLLNSGGDPNLHQDGYTPLMALCSSTRGTPLKRITCLKFLIEAEVYINAANKLKETPLMLACKMQEIDFIEELLEYVDNINFADSEQCTALFYAVSVNRYDVVELLIEKGADINWVNYRGLIAYDIALIKGFEELLPLLSIDHEEEEQERLQTNCVSCWTDMFSPGNEMNMDVIDNDVLSILYGMGLESYKNCFRGIDLKTFLRLTEEDLEKLGIDISVHRTKFIDELFRFHKHEWNTNPMTIDESQPFSTFNAIQILGNINKQLTVMSSSVYYSKNYLNSLEEIEDSNITYEDRERIENEIKNLQATAVRIKDATNRLDNLAKAVNYLSSDISLPIHIEKKKKKSNHKWILITVITTIAGIYLFRMKSMKKLWNKDNAHSKSWKNIFNFSLCNIFYDTLYKISSFTKKNDSLS